MVELVTIGIIAVLAGVLVIALAWFLGRGSSGSEEGEEGRTKVEGGGVLLIGPIPIVFGSDAKWASVAIVLAIILVLLSLFYSLYGGF